LVSLIGRGALSDIYAAHDQTLGMRVVIKQLRAELAVDPAYVRAFIHKLQATSAAQQTGAGLGHWPGVSIASVVQLVDLGHVQGRPYAVLEPITGALLGHRFEERPCAPWPELMAILGPIASALRRLHETGAAHGGLRPSTII